MKTKRFVVSLAVVAAMIGWGGLTYTAFAQEVKETVIKYIRQDTRDIHQDARDIRQDKRDIARDRKDLWGDRRDIRQDIRDRDKVRLKSGSRDQLYNRRDFMGCSSRRSPIITTLVGPGISLSFCIR